MMALKLAVLYFLIAVIEIGFIDGRMVVPKFREDYINSEKTNNYYKFHEEYSNWYDAVAKCKSEGTQLFYPLDVAEIREVDYLLNPWSQDLRYKTSIKFYSGSMWIGVTDQRYTDVYETIDGRPLNEVYNQWGLMGIFSSNSHGPYCVKLNSDDYKLDLTVCSVQYYFVCKFCPGNTGNTTSTQFEITERFKIATDERLSVPKFREDYIYSAKTNNYYKFYNKYYNWQNATSKCKSEGAQLFYPEDVAEAAEVGSLLQWFKYDSSIWIGASDLRSDGVFETVDGLPLKEVHNQWYMLRGPQPEKPHDAHCVEMYSDNYIRLTECSEQSYFICKYEPDTGLSYRTPTEVPVIKEAATVPIETTPVIMNSTHLDGRLNVSIFREDYIYSVNTNNYYKVHEESVTWYDAVAKCKSEGAQLFYPLDVAEVREVDYLLNPWILDTFQGDIIWIGVSDLRVDDVYETVDGRPLNEVYNLWDAFMGQPQNSDNAHCAVIGSADYKLSLSYCKASAFHFVCKYAAGSNQKTHEISKQLTTVTNFREDYTYSANTNNFYKVHKRHHNWHEAVAKCKSEGAQLFYPLDVAEVAEVDTLLRPWTLTNHFLIWIGASDLRSDDVYETVDGRPLDEVHNRWDKVWHQPDKSIGGHCVDMRQYNYKLGISPCVKEYYFVCKYVPETGIGYTTLNQPDITEATTVAIGTTTPVNMNYTHLGSEIPGHSTPSPPGITEASTVAVEITSPVIGTHLGGEIPEHSTPSLFDITEAFTAAIETTSITSTDVGDGIPVLQKKVTTEQTMSYDLFSDLVIEELKRFTPEEKLQIMAAMLEVIPEKGSKTPFYCTCYEQ